MLTFDYWEPIILLESSIVFLVISNKLEEVLCAKKTKKYTFTAGVGLNLDTIEFRP